MLLLALATSGTPFHQLAPLPADTGKPLASLTNPLSTPNTRSVFTGYVKNTLILSNGSLVNGNIEPLNGRVIHVPTAVVYDSHIDRIFVTNGHSLATGTGANTISVLDGSTNQLLSEVPVNDPRGIAYDSSNNYLYVASASGISIISDATSTVISNVTLGKGASGVAYNPYSNKVYVSNYLSSSVSILDGSTNALVANVTVGAYPTGIAYDSHNNVYVNSVQSGIVSIIDGSTNAVAVNVTVNPSPSPPPCIFPGNCRPLQQPSFQDIAYNPSNNNLYVAEVGSGNSNGPVYVVDTITRTVAAKLDLSQGVAGLAYDPDNNHVYVTSGLVGLGNNVAVIDGGTNTVLSNVTVGYGPNGLAYDPRDHYIYVANSRSDSVSILDDSTNSVVHTSLLQAYPAGVAYDPQNKVLYVANEGSSDATSWKDSWSTHIFAVNTTTGSVSLVDTGLVGPSQLAYDPHNNELYATTLQGSAVSVVNASSGSVIKNIPIHYGEYCIAYDSQDHRIYVANNNQFTPTLSVIDDASNTIIATVPEGRNPLNLAYDPTNNDIYVTHYSPELESLEDFVTVVSASTNTVVANITVGPRATRILFDPANNDIYVGHTGVNGGMGEVSIISGSTNTLIATVPVKVTPNLTGLGLVYDPVDNEVFVTNQFPGWPEGGTPSNIVSVIDGNTNTLAGNLTLGFNPADGVYDSDTGYMYISNYRSGTVSIVVPGHSPLLLASASGVPVTGTTPLTVQFTGSASGGTAAYSYLWNFGDGAPTTTLQNPSHQYSQAGTYNAIFSVNDSASQTASSIQIVTPIASLICTRNLSCYVQSNATLSSIRFTGNPIHFQATGPARSHG